jgi:hypothetical protein
MHEMPEGNGKDLISKAHRHQAIKKPRLSKRGFSLKQFVMAVFSGPACYQKQNELQFRALLCFSYHAKAESTSSQIIYYDTVPIPHRF